MTDTLPAIPSSSGMAFDRNYHDGFYDVKARDFWGSNTVVREEVQPFQKCEHEFRATPTGAECSKCRFGLIGPIEVKDGKLHHNGQPLPL